MQPFAILAEFIQAAPRHSQGIAAFLRHLGGIGLFILAIIDGSPIPTFGGLDILIAILAARQREPWYYYTIISTAGGVVGAYATFHMARKAGLDYLNRKFGQRKVARTLGFFKHWGTGALAVSAVLPLPFPTSAFFAVAGVLDYPLQTFIIVVTLCRALRYGLISIVASHYGRRFVIGLRHPERHLGWVMGLTAGVVVATVAAIVVSKWVQSRHTEVRT